MKSKKGSWFIFIIGLISLVISIKLFWNMGVFVDEFNTNPAAVCGGEFWLYMDWLRLGLLFVLCILSGFQCLKKKA